MSKRDKDVGDKTYKNIEQFLNQKIYLDRLPKLRQKWKIPAIGFNDTSTHYEAWRILQLRRRGADNPKNILKTLDAPSIEKDIARLIRKMNYAEEWNKIAYYHIVFNKIITDTYSVLRSNKKMPYVSPIIRHTNSKITLIIFPSTTSKDLRNAVSTITKLQKKLTGYRREVGKKNLKRDLLLLSNYEKNKSVKTALNPNIFPEEYHDT